MTKTVAETLSPDALIDDAQWNVVSLALGDAGCGTRARRTFASLLWILRTGRAWSALPSGETERRRIRAAWRAWMRDGTWLDLWSSYVARLDADGRLAWCRDLVAAGERLARLRSDRRERQRRTVWWTVSTQFLVLECGVAAGGSAVAVLD